MSVVSVVVMGSINADLVVEVAQLPRPGETVAGGDLRRLPGGKGANQAVAAARMGAQVALVGAVGADDLGADLLLGLAHEGVDARAVAVLDGRSSGVALIVVESGGENTITVAPGANGALGPEHVHAAHEVVGAGRVLLLQLEVPVGASRSAAQLARDRGHLVVLNAAPLADPVPAEVLELVALCDVVVVNEQEGAALAASGAPLPARLVTTLGARGARWSVSDADASPTDGSCAAFAVDSLDAVGAGDTFAAALAVALAKGADLAHGVRRGCAAGALTTLATGAQAAMPTAAAVDELLGTAGA